VRHKRKHDSASVRCEYGRHQGTTRRNVADKKEHFESFTVMLRSHSREESGNPRDRAWDWVPFRRGRAELVSIKLQPHLDPARSCASPIDEADALTFLVEGAVIFGVVMKCRRGPLVTGMGNLTSYITRRGS